MAKTQPRILIVADSRDTHTLLQFALSEAGFQVFSAPSEKSALLQIDVVAPHLIILDAQVKGLLEAQKLQRFQERSAVPIITLDGPDGQDQRTQETVGTAVRLSWPLDIQQLYACIRNLLPLDKRLPDAPEAVDAKLDHTIS
jgi:two-component system OmpR family response regulator